MHVALFCHSVISDWNNGNAHFLRGVVGELQSRGHTIKVYEPLHGWSVSNLVLEHGSEPLTMFKQMFPTLDVVRYDLHFELEQALDQADLVLVHEWNDPDLVARIGQHHALVGGYVLLFHDTHHRSVTAPHTMARYDLRHYDGALVFGAVVRDLYQRYNWAEHVWVWHEAADTRVFRPYPELERRGDVVWVGNWGDDERTRELREFLIEPVAAQRLRARIHGVRYPASALAELRQAQIEYAGWLPNAAVPQIFARYAATIHVMRRPYVQSLPGIPTIRVFEALACGIPLICSPWDDAEGLFTPTEDFLIAQNTTHMITLLARLLRDHEQAQHLINHGLATIRSRHTCAHRVDELLAIYETCAAFPVAAELPQSSALDTLPVRTKHL